MKKLQEIYNSLEVRKLYQFKNFNYSNYASLKDGVCVYAIKDNKNKPLAENQKELCRLEEDGIFLILEKFPVCSKDFVEIKVLCGDTVGWIDVGEVVFKNLICIG